MIKRFVSYCQLASAYFLLNFKAQLAYKGAFVAQICGMFINNAFMLAFWLLFFSRFPVLRGWQINDVVTMWAVASVGFGLSHVLFGNSSFLPGLIAKGQLDVWLLYPRVLLSHFLLGKMSATAVGDTLFGLFIYLSIVRPDLPHLALFIVMAFSVFILFTGFSVMAGSLGFFVGNAETINEQWHFAMICFSLYPATLFDGKIRIILLTLIPAMFVNYFPVEALRSLSLIDACYALAGAFAVLAFGIFLFYYGLKHYESGNLMEMRG